MKIILKLETYIIYSVVDDEEQKRFQVFLVVILKFIFYTMEKFQKFQILKAVKGEATRPQFETQTRYSVADDESKKKGIKCF